MARYTLIVLVALCFASLSSTAQNRGDISADKLVLSGDTSTFVDSTFVPVGDGTLMYDTSSGNFVFYFRGRRWLLPDSLVTGGGSITPDSLSRLLTTGPRLFNVALLSRGLTGQLLVMPCDTCGPVWSSDPGLADRVAHIGYTGSILPHNAADTSGNKHVLLWTALDRELPVAHGSAYSSATFSVAIRWGVSPYTVHTYSTTWTNVSGGAATLAAGDRIVVRFFPKAGLSTDKVAKWYRVPAGTAPFNSMYGQELGTINIPVAKFPPSAGDQVNLIFNFGYKVR